MKAIIDIIKEKIETGDHDVNLAHYKNHTEQNLPTAGWEGELPDVGDILTNGEMDMAVVAYEVYGDDVGVLMDSGQRVTANQIKQMIADKICWIKEA